MSANELEAAIAAHQAGDVATAEAGYRNVIASQPKQPIAYANLALICLGNGRRAESIALLRRAIAIKPDYAEGLRNLGRILGDGDEAIDCLQRAIAARPDLADAHNDLGNLWLRRGAPERAIEAFRDGLAAAPDFAPSWNNLGNALRAQKRRREAENAYRKAIEYAPQLLDARSNLGELLLELNRRSEALAVFQALLSIDPKHPLARTEIIQQRLAACDWQCYDADLAELEALYREGRTSLPPFHAVTFFDDPTLTCKAAETCVRHNGPKARSAEQPCPRPGPRIRLAYLSADLHDHATAQLIAELFELHDRAQFEVHVFSTGPDDGSGIRARLLRAIEHFHDVRDWSELTIAARMRELGIEVLVDLKGHTYHTPLSVLAWRPAPVQVHYLGYPGSLGAEFVDYLIVDRQLVPDAERPHYHEALVYLPGSYQINDRRKAIATDASARSEHGLPDGSFVYCCFNSAYKLTPEVFASWMRILLTVPGSVLWLLVDDELVRDRLCKEARGHGVDDTRLVFAGRLPLPRHLERLRHADLFLDTFPCNAHTTASDALWAGVPLLTRTGRSFAARVAASLLHAVGLPQLVIETPAEYERLAIALAGEERSQLAAYRERLRQRERLRLFDSPRTTRALEAAYRGMLDRWRLGLPPESFHVEDPPEPPMETAFQTRIPYTGCPLCGAPLAQTPIVTADCSQHPLFKPPLEPQMRWHECASCHHVHTDGYYTEEALQLIFADTNAHQKVGHDLENQRLISARLIDKVLPYADRGAWLDVGFGNGALLLTAAEYGFEAVGMDLRSDNVDILRQLGVQAHCLDITQWQQPGRFAVISLCDVLEHMPYPAQGLTSAHEMLADGGVMLLSLPNSDSVAWTLLSLNQANPYWAELEHYHNFGRERLYELLDETGFDVLRYGVSERYRVGMEVIARKRS